MKKEEFEVLDARQVEPGSFLPAVIEKAKAIPAEGGLHIIQSFEPVPLYSVLEGMGFEHEMIEEDGIFHVYFSKKADAPESEWGGREIMTIDGRKEDPGSFLPTLTAKAQALPEEDILHIIQSFDPVPLYAVLGNMGFEHKTNQDEEGNFHAYFFKTIQPPTEAEMEEGKSLSAKMGGHLNVKPERIDAIMGIVKAFYDGADSDELRKRFEDELGSISPVEFAFVEQKMTEHGISDGQFKMRVEELLGIFKKSLMQASTPDFPAGHPIDTFKRENIALKALVDKMRAMAKDKGTSEAEWKDAFEKLWEVDIHYVRKENQLFPRLEQKGFDKPSKVMWALHDSIRVSIKKARRKLEKGDMDGMLAALPKALEGVIDMIFKEDKILWPTSIAMLDEDEWVIVRNGEEELGYCLIDPPPAWELEGVSKEAAVGATSLPKKKAKAKAFIPPSQKPSVSLGAIGLEEGYLTPEQISLLLQALPLEITFISEYDEVRYFNREEGDAEIDEKIVAAFKEGTQDKVARWGESEGNFIYQSLVALRDDEGNYKGILNIKQDVTEIRALEGEQRILDWK